MADVKDQAEEDEKPKIMYENFREELFFNLNELRESNTLCDTTIRAQGQDFPAHRCVLSAASPYFRAMFTSELKEKESSLVELKEIKSTTISDVLHYIYTGETAIDPSNAKDLVMVADYLIIPSLKKKAAFFLQNKMINVSNCLALESFASQYDCQQLRQAAVSFQTENFPDVFRSEDFTSLDSKKVKELICMDEINVTEEEEVYEAVMAWVKHDLPTRECTLPELLKCVRLFSMSKSSLRRILDQELVSKSLECTRIVINSLDLFLFPVLSQDTSLKPRLSLKDYEDVVVLTSEQPASEEKDDHVISCFVLATMTWKSLTTMPFNCEYHDAAVCGGLLYVVGGVDSTSVSCFKQNKWYALDTKLKGKDCTVTSFDDELFVIGGDDSWHDVRIYNPVLNEWRQGGSMETSRAGHNAVVLQGHIYVLAGHNGEECLNSAECYNPSTDQWAEISSMSAVRRSAAAVAVGGKIVVVGGFSDMSICSVEPSCEIFDPSANQWSLVPSLSIPRARSGIMGIGDSVYLFGGEDEENYRSEVECFDLKTGEWDKISDIPSPPYTGLRASLLKLPKAFIESSR
ncbi:kelch-like protein 12 [Stylophora pistillata]|uniref:kelch-like protein 12 n=1 Tax=Stylophora pistillata TaxID=50429 RepID=UPI000C043D25|nr:kelch-like protein 12 [Stylophora pistillata]